MTSADEVARRFERNDWISAPVVDPDGKLIGRITIDDVVDVIREQADYSLAVMAGLGDGDAFTPVLSTAPQRAIWLAINLATAILAASVIGLFQDTIEKVVALAVLMPIVASMGGIAGTQSLTVLIVRWLWVRLTIRKFGWCDENPCHSSMGYCGQQSLPSSLLIGSVTYDSE